MDTPATAAAWFLPFVVPISLWVAYSDLRRMIIPNRAVMALLAVFIVLGPFVLPLDDWGWRWVNFAVVLVAGFVFSSLGLGGAGDAKFAAAMAPFVAVGDLSTLSLLLAAIVLATVIVHRILGRIPAFLNAVTDWKSWHSGKKFPMGLPLSLTVITYLGLAATS